MTGKLIYCSVDIGQWPMIDTTQQQVLRPGIPVTSELLIDFCLLSFLSTR